MKGQGFWTLLFVMGTFGGKIYKIYIAFSSNGIANLLLLSVVFAHLVTCTVQRLFFCLGGTTTVHLMPIHYLVIGG